MSATLSIPPIADAIRVRVAPSANPEELMKLLELVSIEFVRGGICIAAINLAAIPVVGFSEGSGNTPSRGGVREQKTTSERTST